MIMDYHRGNREIHGIPNQAVLNSIESIASEVLRHVQEDQAKGSKKRVRVNMRCYGRVTRRYGPACARRFVSLVPA